MQRIELINISKKFNEKVIFQNLNIILSAGEAVHLKGPNGSGKSTLLNIICTIIDPTEGKCIAFNSNNQMVKISERDVTLFSGEEKGFFPRLSGLENILFFSNLTDYKQVDLEKHLDIFSSLPQFKDLMKTPYYLQSKGMKQLLSFITLSLKDSSILLFDESFSAIDIKTRDLIYSYLKKSLKNKVTIFVEHSETISNNISKRVIHLDEHLN